MRSQHHFPFHFKLFKSPPGIKRRGSASVALQVIRYYYYYYYYYDYYYYYYYYYYY